MGEKQFFVFVPHRNSRKIVQRIGDSVVEAKERVAEIALKELLALNMNELHGRLNQDFADDIER